MTKKYINYIIDKAISNLKKAKKEQYMVRKLDLQIPVAHWKIIKADSERKNVEVSRIIRDALCLYFLMDFFAKDFSHVVHPDTGERICLKDHVPSLG